MDRKENDAKNALKVSTKIDPGKIGLVKNKKLYYSYLPPAFQKLQERRRKDIQERWDNSKVKKSLKKATQEKLVDKILKQDKKRRM